jgi:hypothetical protein
MPAVRQQPAIELTRRELQEELIRPTLIQHPRKARSQ